jgi:hypothetical protein
MDLETWNFFIGDFEALGIKLVPVKKNSVAFSPQEDYTD